MSELKRKLYSIGNWKMNTSLDEAMGLSEKIKAGVSELTNTITILCPPYVWLQPLEAIVGRSENFGLGAQNMHYDEKGPYTGEISPNMLSELVGYVILGHSERRHRFGESNELINWKIKAALNHNIIPIIGVGEKERVKLGKDEYLTGQLEASIDGLSEEEISKVVLAYEPVWAIGSGSTKAEDAATGEYAKEKIGVIREVIAKKYNGEIANNISILYGGSVCGANVAEYTDKEGIDGVLVGGVSLKGDEFVEICKILDKKN